MIARLNPNVTLLVDDRLDVVLAARSDSIIGLSARTVDLIDYVKTADIADINYFGAGSLKELARVSPLPIVVGGGVKVDDLPQLAATGVDGFFVVSAVAGADDPLSAARELVDCWKKFSHPPAL